jgi:UDP-N-acetylglucosamine--N-acetylmuramyl-(pentapeptide) pyrophosphoryl-undecaprenol N-acetylglucosamine transferase
VTERPPLRIVIAGGGTGGHVLPAVSVLEEFRRREMPLDVLWIGSREGVERAAAENAGVRYAAVETGKFRRYLDFRTFADGVRFPAGIVQSWRLLRSFRPDVVFSTGGFVSVPTVIAARKIAPVLTHEQTTIIGLATKINMRFADVLALSYEQTRPLAAEFRGETIVTGNPVRQSLLAGDAMRGLERFGFTPGVPLLYVTGGARGASPINERIESLLPHLLDLCQVLHQTGPAGANSDASRLRAKRARWPAELQRRYQVVEFVRDELPDVYAAASLLVARAGAGTVAELAFLGKPAILIPLPLSGGGEQDVNAHMLRDAGAAVVIPQAEATAERLRSEIASLLGNPARLNEMSARAKLLGRADAAAELTDALLGLVARAKGR